MPKVNNSKMENQFAVLMNNKYMREDNPYPTINNESTKVKKNIGEWGTKSNEVFKAPEPTKKSEPIKSIEPVKPITKITISLPTPKLRNTRLEDEVNNDHNNNDDFEEE